MRCRKNTENLNSKIFKAKNGRLIIQSKCAECGIKKSRFVKEQDAKWLLSNLGIKCFILGHIKMNEIVNKFLLAEDRFMPEMHLKQLGFTYTKKQTKKELKSLCRLEIQTLFTETSLLKQVFSMIWPMANQKI